MFKDKRLNYIFLISLAAAIALPLISVRFIHPSFTDTVVRNTENEAVRMARHLLSVYLSEATELRKESLSDDFILGIEQVAKDYELEKVKVFALSGEIIYSTNPEDIGTINTKSYFHEIVAQGNVLTKLVQKETETLEGRVVSVDVVETYVPIMYDDSFIGAFGIYYNITHRSQELNTIMLRSSIIPFAIMFVFLVVIALVSSTLDRNITERKQAEEALRESEERYRILFEQANDAIHIENENDEIVDVNRRACEMLGYSREELLNMKVPDLQAPEVRGQTGSVVRTEWARYGNNVFEALNIHRDGTRIPTEVSISKVTGLEGDLYISIVRDITERKQAEEALRQRTAQLEALRGVGLELTAQLDLDTLLHSVASRAVELLGGIGGGLYLYRPDRNVLEWAVAVGSGTSPLGTVLHRGESLAGRVWETGETLMVDDYQHWEGQAAVFEGYPLTSIVDAPVHWGPAGAGGEFLGVLSVNGGPTRTFSQADAELLSLFATQAAIVIHNARLYEESQRRSLEQETVGRIARALNTLDVRDAFPVLVGGLQTLTACDRVSLALQDESGEHFIMSLLESPFPALGEGTSMPLSATAAAEDILAGRLHMTADLSTEADFPGEMVFYQAGFRSRVNLPLLVGGEPIGALNLASRRPAHFRGDQLPVLQQIADVLASAVENSRLFGAEQRLRQEADTLREAALALTAALDQPEVIERILAQLQKVVPYDTCSVQLLRTSPEHGREDRLEIVGGRGFPNLPDLLGVSFAIGGDNPNSEVIRRQAPVIVADAPTEYADFLREPHAQARIRSWLGVQMLMGEQLVGMIALDKQEPGFYTQEHARLAQAFAAQAAIAVENARLYEQAQQDAETKAVLLNEVNHRVKNNLTGIMGLLYTARDYARVEGQATYQSTMNDLIVRVRGLATVHSLLSASEWAPLRLSDLAAEVIRIVLEALPRSKRAFTDVPLSPVRVTADQAHNLALVINELATNTVKYALKERDTAQITFHIARDDGTAQAAPMVRCEFRDDGPGYPEDVLRLERHNLGFDLVQNIVRGSLRGELSLHNDRGAVAVIHFREEVGSRE